MSVLPPKASKNKKKTARIYFKHPYQRRERFEPSVAILKVHRPGYSYEARCAGRIPEGNKPLRGFRSAAGDSHTQGPSCKTLQGL